MCSLHMLFIIILFHVSLLVRMFIEPFFITMFFKSNFHWIYGNLFRLFSGMRFLFPHFSLWVIPFLKIERVHEWSIRTPILIRGVFLSILIFICSLVYSYWFLIPTLFVLDLLKNGSKLVHPGVCLNVPTLAPKTNLIPFWYYLCFPHTSLISLILILSYITWSDDFSQSATCWQVVYICIGHVRTINLGHAEAWLRCAKLWTAIVW